MTTRRTSALATTVLIAGSALIPGCLQRSRVDREIYDEWIHDPDRTPLDLPCSPSGAFWLSMLFPCFGFLYLDEGIPAILWSTVGLLTWPLTVPACIADHDAHVINERYVAEHVGHLYRRGGPLLGNQQQQQQQQSSNNNNNNIVVPQAPVVVHTTVVNNESGQNAPPPPRAPNPTPVDKQAPVAAKFCMKCGTGLPIEAAFCLKCGQKQSDH